jgi:hypothetical protein
MVYNHDSVWVHLYVPYIRQIAEGIDRDLPLAEAFKRSTDGPDCPHSVSYRPDDFLALAEQSGFAGSFLGAAVSVHELSLLSERAAAIQHPKLDEEHREFLEALTFDEHGRPLINGQVAGIDGFFELRKAA